METYILEQSFNLQINRWVAIANGSEVAFEVTDIHWVKSHLGIESLFWRTCMVASAHLRSSPRAECQLLSGDCLRDIPSPPIFSRPYQDFRIPHEQLSHMHLARWQTQRGILHLGDKRAVSTPCHNVHTQQPATDQNTKFDTHY